MDATPTLARRGLNLPINEALGTEAAHFATTAPTPSTQTTLKTFLTRPR